MTFVYHGAHFAGVVASVVSLATFSIAGSSAERYFAVALSLSIAVIPLSYVAVFAAPVRLRRTRPDVERPFRVPARTIGLDVCSALSALARLLWPPHLPDAFHGERATFQPTQVVPLALLVLCRPAFASAGGRSLTRESGSPERRRHERDRSSPPRPLRGRETAASARRR